MHIIKRPLVGKRFLIGGCVAGLSILAQAHERHEQMMQMDASHMNHAQHQVKVKTSQSLSQENHSAHDHRHEHGGQIYQATTLENAWTLDERGQGRASTELNTWVGTDENKVFIKAHVEKAESEKNQTDVMVLYSRNIDDFWDLQTGVAYQFQPEQSLDQNQWNVVFGIHGLAPYFFETEAYVYAGSDQRWQFSLESSRDLLLTQKWIAQAYLKTDVVLSDQSKYARHSGLAKLQTGVQLRYEINKKVMPFIDLAYLYDKGKMQTAWQSATNSEKGGIYGLGLMLKF
ncbi:MAG: copper resistance protein B [Acinetobacter sp.]